MLDGADDCHCLMATVKCGFNLVTGGVSTSLNRLKLKRMDRKLEKRSHVKQHISDNRVSRMSRLLLEQRDEGGSLGGFRRTVSKAIHR